MVGGGMWLHGGVWLVVVCGCVWLVVVVECSCWWWWWLAFVIVVVGAFSPDMHCCVTQSSGTRMLPRCVVHFCHFIIEANDLYYYFVCVN